MNYINNQYDNTVAGVIAGEQADKPTLDGITNLYDSLHRQKIEREEKENRIRLAALIRSIRKGRKPADISDKVTNS